jgi:hypothetical protein
MTFGHKVRQSGIGFRSHLAYEILPVSRVAAVASSRRTVGLHGGVSYTAVGPHADVKCSGRLLECSFVALCEIQQKCADVPEEPAVPVFRAEP